MNTGRGARGPDSEDLSVQSPVVVHGGLYPGRLNASKFADRSPTEVAVLLGQSYRGPVGERTPEDADLGLELMVVVPPRQWPHLDFDSEFFATLPPEGSHDRLAWFDGAPGQSPSLIAVGLAQ